MQKRRPLHRLVLVLAVILSSTLLTLSISSGPVLPQPERAPTKPLQQPKGSPSKQSTYEIVVNVPAYRLYLYQDGIRIRSYPIGIGRVLKPSVLGETEIINRVIYPTYYPPDWYLKGLQPIPPGPDNPVGTRWLGLGFPGYVIWELGIGVIV